jgi:hypothetical protein
MELLFIKYWRIDGAVGIKFNNKSEKYKKKIDVQHTFE